MPCNPHRSQAQLDRRHRRPVGPVHPAWCARPCPFRQRPGVHRQGCTGVVVAVGAKTAFIEPGSPWENGYCESFNSKLRDELLDGEIFYSLAEAKIIIEAWRRYYNTERPHSSLGYKPPAPEAIIWPAPASGAAPSSAQAIAPRPI